MDHFSVTQLNMYLRCPAQYAFRYIDNIKLPPTAALTKGRAVHKGAEHNYRKKLTTAADVPAEEFNDVVADAFEREAAETAWKPGEDRGKAKDETIALASLYHREVAPQVQPMFVEHGFSLNIPGLSRPLIGFIDVIDDRLTIRDIKTASKAPSADEAARSLQLAAYALAYRQLSGDEENGVALDYLINSKQPKTVTLTAKLSAGELNRLMAVMASVAASIEAGSFHPNPMNFMCSENHCGYWKICRAKYGGMTA